MEGRNNSQAILDYLRVNGAVHTNEITEHFGISRPTLSRRIQELGRAVVAIGAGRSTHYGARHEEVSGGVPLYQVDERGVDALVGQLVPIRAGERTEWLLESSVDSSGFMGDGCKNGLYPGWPWFLEDSRPSGFLGRAFGKRMSGVFGIAESPDEWTDLQLIRVLESFGSNLPGNFIVGDGNALAGFQAQKLRIRGGNSGVTPPERYPVAVESILRDGEDFGSSAGGEQPKFVAVNDAGSPVIVKFSPVVSTPGGRRWADLLHAEQIANEVLRESGIDCAKTRIFEFEDRVFLESERFDRLGALGRRGVVSLRSMEGSHIGSGRGDWASVARSLENEGWITQEDCQRIVELHTFGGMIANTDMHLGNLSLFLGDERPYPLAPVYDMLPMFFRPTGTGEVVERSFAPSLPKPEDRSVWCEMLPCALEYWNRIVHLSSISEDFSKIGEAALRSLENLAETKLKEITNAMRDLV